MAITADDVREHVKHAEAVLSAVEEALNPQEFVGFEAEEAAYRCVLAAMTYRSMNLARSAVDAARQGYGETVALAARCMQEMLYTAKGLAKDSSMSRDFLLYSLDEQKAAAMRIAKGRAGGDESKLDLSTVERLARLRGPDEHTWAKHVSMRAKAAGMEKNYTTEYAFLSMQAHSDGYALMLYQLSCNDGVEVWPKMWPGAVFLYLQLAIVKFVDLTDVLLPMFGARESPPELKCAWREYESYMGDFDLAHEMRPPPVFDWDSAS